jgi:hypothetical protein
MTALAGLACAPKLATKPTTPPPSDRRASPATDDLDALATAIDPGPVPLPALITPELEQVLRKQLPEPATARRYLAAATDELWTATHTLPDKFHIENKDGPAVLNMILGIVRVELDVDERDVDPETARLLERAYLLAAWTNRFAIMMIGVEAQEAAVRIAGSPEGGPYLIEVVRAMLATSGARHRHAIARVLRCCAEPGAVDGLLLGALEVLGGSDEPEVEALVRRTYLARKPDDGPQVLRSAKDCYRQLDLACGDAALARGRGMPRVEPAQVADVEEVAARARTAAAIGPTAPVEARMARAEQLVTFGRARMARAELEAIVGDARDDARPLVMLGWIAVEAGDLAEARRRLTAATDLQHRERSFHDLLLMLGFLEAGRAMRDRDAFFVKVNAVLAEVRQQLPGLAQIDPARAAVLTLAADVFAKLFALNDTRPFGARLRDVLPAALAVRDRHPEDVTAHQMVLAATYFSGDRSLARAAILAAPTGTETQRRERAAALLHHILVWRAADLWPQATAAAEQLARDGADLAAADLLRGDLLAVRATLKKEPASWRAAADAYKRAIAASPGEDLARACNNHGVALARQGKLAEARDAWHASAAARAELLEVPSLNNAVSDPAAADARKTIEAVAAGPVGATMAVQAIAWLIHLDGKNQDPSRASQLRDKLVELRAESPFAAPITGEAGATLPGVAEFMPNFTTKRQTGLWQPVVALHVEVGAPPWLLLPAPGKLPQLDKTK